MANNKQIQARILMKHDTTAHWDEAVNFIPKLGEIIIYSDDPRQLKIGDGVTTVSNLLFMTDAMALTNEDIDQLFETET